jgi:hypothetical protein
VFPDGHSKRLRHIDQEYWATGVQFAQHGTISHRSHMPRRPSALYAAAIEDISDLIRDAPSLFLEEIADWLAVCQDQPIDTAPYTSLAGPWPGRHCRARWSSKLNIVFGAFTRLLEPCFSPVVQRASKQCCKYLLSMVLLPVRSTVPLS